MRSTAETARLAAVEHCREESKTYVEQLQAQTVDEAGSLRRDSEADVATIRSRSKSQVDQVRAETEERIARRMEHLQQELADYNAAIELEVQRVQERVVAFEAEVQRFFETLLQGADPTVFANMAYRMPSPPEFDPNRPAPAPEPSKPDQQTDRGPGPQAAQAGGPAAQAGGPAASAAMPAAMRAPIMPGTLSGAGAVRGRLYSEWYPEVERLRAIGDDEHAVILLLDIVTATEAEAQAEGSYVSPRAYDDLAAIFLARNDPEEELSILERFARQDHAPTVVAAKLLERRKVLKKQIKR
jgi:hypothetical protein